MLRASPPLKLPAPIDLQSESEWNKAREELAEATKKQAKIGLSNTAKKTANTNLVAAAEKEKIARLRVDLSALDVINTINPAARTR